LFFNALIFHKEIDLNSPTSVGVKHTGVFANSPTAVGELPGLYSLTV
jgi:hypothetical protein